jgi:hypothetical protein
MDLARHPEVHASGGHEAIRAALARGLPASMPVHIRNRTGKSAPRASAVCRKSEIAGQILNGHPLMTEPLSRSKTIQYLQIVEQRLDDPQAQLPDVELMPGVTVTGPQFVTQCLQDLRSGCERRRRLARLHVHQLRTEADRTDE